MERNRKIIQTSMIAIAANLLLVGIKSVIGIISGSIAIIMDGVNNLSDALSSIITILGTKIAGKSPDKKHPYGYGRIEYLTSITIAVIILLAGFSSFLESLQAIREGTDATYSVVSVLAISIAVIVKFVLGKFVKERGKKYHSDSLVASGTDALYDSIISASTLLAAFVSIVFHVSLEGFLGIIIAIVVAKAGVEILMDSIGSIVGKRIDSDLVINLKKQIQNYSEVKGVYDLILHQYGPDKYIGSVHVEVNDELTAKEIHKLTRMITTDIFTNFGIVITVGIYASNTETNEFAEIKNYIIELISVYPEILQMHGFYVESEKKTISFDLVIDFSLSDVSAIKNHLLKQLNHKYAEYQFYIIFENNYSDIK